MANLKRKNITVARHKFTLEIYPARNGCHGKEGPYFEKINNLIKKKYME